MRFPELILEEILSLLCLEELLPLRSINTQFLQTINRTLQFDYGFYNQESTAAIEEFLPKLGQFITSISIDKKFINYAQLIIDHCPNVTSIRLEIIDSGFLRSPSVFASARKILLRGNVHTLHLCFQLDDVASLLNGVNLDKLVLGCSESILFYQCFYELLTEIKLPELKKLEFFTSRLCQEVSESIEAKFPLLEELVITDACSGEDKQDNELFNVNDQEVVEQVSGDTDFYNEEHFNDFHEQSRTRVLDNAFGENLRVEETNVQLRLDSDHMEDESDEAERSFNEESMEEEINPNTENNNNNNNNIDNMEWNVNNDDDAFDFIFRTDKLPRLEKLNISTKLQKITILLPKTSQNSQLTNLVANALEFNELGRSIWTNITNFHLVNNVHFVDQMHNLPHHLPNLKVLILSQEGEVNNMARILELKDYLNLESLTLVGEENSELLIKLKPKLNLLTTLRLNLSAEYFEQVLAYCFKYVPNLTILEVLPTYPYYDKLPRTCDPTLTLPLITSLTIGIENEDLVKLFRFCSTIFPNLVNLNLYLKYINSLISSLTTPGCTLPSLKSLTLSSQKVTPLAELLEFCTKNLPQLEEIILPDLTRVNTSVLSTNKSKLILPNLSKFFTKNPLPVDVYLYLLSVAPKLFVIKLYLNCEIRLAIRESVVGDRFIIFKEY